MSNRSDKFTYTDPRQIKIGTEQEPRDQGQREQFRTLRNLVNQENLDLEKVLELVQSRLDELRRPTQP